MAAERAGCHEETVPCLRHFKMSQQDEHRKRSLGLDTLVAMFGVGAWVGVNGMYVQLPLLVATAPEGWNLPNYMAVVIQLANVGPLAYSALRKLAPRIPDSTYIYGVLAQGTLAAVLMAFLYGVTTELGGEQRSTVFLTLVFCIALVGCCSSVLFYPFMRHYRELYLISYLVGEGLSGFIPSVAALAQGVGGNGECVLSPDNSTYIQLYREPRFETRYFLLFVAALMSASLISFIWLNATKSFDTEKVPEVESLKEKQEQDYTPRSKSLTSVRHLTLLVLMGSVCALGNGVFPSVQSYSCLPYGNTAYHLAVTLSSMANPLACFLAVFLPRTTNLALATLSAACAAFTSYILATALMSPAPPLLGQVLGEVIVVTAWIGGVALVSYIKLCVATVFRALGQRAMFACGAVSQLGSALGSLLLFLLLNYTVLFRPAQPCH